MKIFFKFIVLIFSLNSLIFANDIISILTNNKFNDKSNGVKVLSPNEEKNIIGGYQAYLMQLSQNELAIVAIPTWEHELGIKDDGNGGYYGLNNIELRNSGKLCGVDQTKCIKNTTTTNRLYELMGVVGPNPYQQLLGYTVKRNVGYSRNGSFVYFSYGVAQFYAPRGTPNGSYFRIHSSQILNNNLIIKELRDNFGKDLEYILNRRNAK